MRTHQYREIISETCHHKHLSADEIFEIIKKTHPKIWRATIYRNLEQMSEEWILRKIPWQNGKSYYEENHIAHAHLVDDKTKIFSDFDIKNIDVRNIPDWYEISEICIFIKKQQ